MSYESDGEEDENGDEDWDGEDSVSQKADKKAKKAGRKAKWSQSLLDDTIDIIISSGYYKKKLIFTNVKTQKMDISMLRYLLHLRRLIICSEETNIYISAFPNAWTPEWAKNHEISICFLKNAFIALCHVLP